jgi:2-C-methyl-D-erythritol 4-phosphate cytidylyltransferase
MQAVAIVPAAGHGARMRSLHPKVLTPLLDRPLLAWTLEPILDLGIFSEILIACPPEDRDIIAQILTEETDMETRARLVAGGKTRQESVANCLREISVDCDLVAIHDGARPLLTPELMVEVLNRANETDAAIAAVPSKDTVKLCDEEGIISSTLDRSRVWLAQTPQCFRHSLLVSAYEKAHREGYVATDDAALVERAGAPVHIVMGSYENIKVTTPEDIPICEEILKQRRLE